MDADSEMLRILGNMGSQDSQARLEAVRYLGENGDDRAIQPLCEALLRDKSLDVRESAAYSLSKIDCLGDSADALLKAIKNHRDAEWKEEYCILTTIVMALGKVCISHSNDDPFHYEVIEKLAEIMLDSNLTLATGWPREGFENGRCNTEAALALAWVADKSSISSLFEAFSQHYDSFEFDEEGYDEEIAIWDADEDTLSRDDFINHTSFWAMWSIGAIGHTDALPQLRAKIGWMSTQLNNGNFESWELGLWNNVIEAIGKCGNNSTLVYNPSYLLWDFFQNLEPGYLITNLRVTVLSALIEIHDSDLIDRLIEVLKKGENSLQEHAAKALGEIGDPIAVKPLCEIINHIVDNFDEWNPRGNPLACVAVRALGEIGDDSSIDILVKSLWWVASNPWNLDYYMPAAEESVFALASIGTDRAIDELIRFLDESQPIQQQFYSDQIHNLIRFIIIEKLQEMDVNRSIDVLIDRLGDVHIKNRAAAACALGHFRADGAVEPLTELLNRRPDPNAELLEGLPWENDRIQSAIALGKIANRDSSEVLIKALDDEHQWIRAGTAQGLVHFVDDCRGWPTELTKPLSLAFHQDECEDVRKYSRIALAKIITRTYYNFSQAQSEIFGDIAEGLADKIFDEHVLDKNLREGLKWLGEHGYR